MCAHQFSILKEVQVATVSCHVFFLCASWFIISPLVLGVKPFILMISRKTFLFLIYIFLHVCDFNLWDVSGLMYNQNLKQRNCVSNWICHQRTSLCHIKMIYHMTNVRLCDDLSVEHAMLHHCSVSAQLWVIITHVSALMWSSFLWESWVVLNQNSVRAKRCRGTTLSFSTYQRQAKQAR